MGAWAPAPFLPHAEQQVLDSHAILAAVGLARERVISGRAPTPLVRLDYTGASSEEEDCAADEVMPAAKAKSSLEIRCDWACAHPVMTAAEIEVGYCSGRRCKAKMHHGCFMCHTGEAGAALGDLVRFCQACWAKQ